jgi:predicted TIM-barrel fold metal-dependent hydrolase
VGVIDCDCHVIECEQTWKYLDPRDRIYEPNVAGMPMCFFARRCTSRSRMRGSRIFDALGIDVQVLISTAFISVEIDNPLEEAALSGGYNRWLAEIVGDRSDRLPWLLRAPLRSMDRAFEEMEFGKTHGAVGIHLRGVEHGMYLSDPYLFPLYEKAQDLDLAIVVHQGEATRASRPRVEVTDGPCG